MKKGVICLGEALIDFIPLDNENITYQKSPGGAPANVAVGVARLGAPSTFLGKVGEDVLGRFLKDTLTNYGVGTDHMLLTKKHRTGVVFVTLDKDGDRSFDFYIDPSADRFLETGEINPQLFAANRILHFGSISMIDQPAKEATQKAVKLAKDAGMIVSYDPNLRPGLWRSLDEAKKTIISMLNKADVVKLSDEELTFITGEDAIKNGIEKIKAYQIPLLFITLGAKGSVVVINGKPINIPAMTVDTVDTTGAGDAFVSVILYKLNEYDGNIAGITVEQAIEIGKYASVSGALAASTKGAMTALPDLKQIEEYVKKLGDV
ncbi:aminoimidazole riboside kinase [Aquibacillus koreensis]|uniref:Aminoimidazole riboside kinase n=1 Tax=Aquibacillus koreensis TaxID=279446 RepID=A0A9X3WLU9_9BACI|nr:aminoimidazole riboside kinase [Aquibacillus koreensis]MCT2537828.1 aminoimidazole riboside kinase [Aquibacillus koreensis]MDC3421140.1 aminoimidazole riboside kinase [Aquibacillus koreensis]